jgi:hypothetical protein
LERRKGKRKRGRGMPISWPATVLLTVLTLCATALVWKGIIPSHAFFMVAGAALGYAFPKSSSSMRASLARGRDERGDSDSSGGAFARDELPTSPGKKKES